MKRIISVLSVAALLVLAIAAVPAFSEAQGKGPQGKGPGVCGVLGTAVSQNAKDPGPIDSVGPRAPGQTLKATCTPAGQ